MSSENPKFDLKPKDGFYELPYVANSPETMVDSFDKMPFTKHSKKNKQLSIDTPFLKGQTRYENIVDGLWLFYSNIDYKENISFKTINTNELPSDYYILRLHLSGNPNSKKRPVINGYAFSIQSWLLFKPKANNSNYFFKDSSETSIAIYFNETWLQKVLYKNTAFLKSKLKDFFESKAQYIIWPDMESHSIDLIQRTTLYFKNRSLKEEKSYKDLKTIVNDTFNRFIEKYKLDNVGKKCYDIPSKDRKEILRSEKVLCANLKAKFSGIETLACAAGMSETKFKRCFKLVYGLTPYQYYQSRQMLLAREMLQKNTHRIGDLAKLFRYENTGKFSTAFKKNFGYLPSEIKPSTV